MRTVTVNALAELTKLNGTEPILIVGIEWVEGSVTFYADKQLPGVRDKILSIGQIQSVVVGNKTSQNVTVELEDTDSEIKTILDAHNIHKVTCFVYQYYGDLSNLADKFVLFQGQISTPFTWSEKSGSISFTIVSEIESYEVGFSPEEGQLDFVNQEYEGQPWPLCFGNVVHAPAQVVSQTLEGRLLDTVCVVDSVLLWKLKRLQFQFWEQAFLMRFYTLVANGADTLAFPAAVLVDEYVKVILRQRSSLLAIGNTLNQLDQAKTLIARGKGGPAIKITKLQLEGLLQNVAVQSNIIQFQKDNIEGQIDLAVFRHDIQQNAFLRMIEANSAMAGIYAEYIAIQAEICNQNECVVPSVRIENGQNFPQGSIIDLFVNNVKFRGTFDDEVFTFFEQPTAKYHNVNVGGWSRDDDECAPDDDSNGLNLFYLAASPPVNLVGMHLLVKQRGTGQHHIIKVDRQVGQKVYFDLVQWAIVGEGGPRGLSLDQVIGNLVNTPFINVPWGGTLPIDLFNGNWDVSVWNRPESQFLLQMIMRIPGGVNQRELEMLAKAVYLIPDDSMFGLVIPTPTARDVYTLIGEDIDTILEASSFVHWHWLDEHHDIPFEELPDSLFWSAPVGTTVRTANRDCTIYIANILPSTIKAVHAYRTLENNSRILAPVPSSYYVKNESADLGTLTVTALTFPFKLSNIPGEGWEDEVYVTLDSSIGPNVCDIIQWLVEEYTNIGVNVANFAAVKTKFQSGGDELYPASFCLLDRPNVLEEIERISWEARCAIYRIGNEFFLKYLAEEPTTDATFTESLISDDTHLDVSFPQTENLITRLVANWQSDYLPLAPSRKQKRIILRNNIKQYGLHSETIDFHIYNIRSLVEKSATFWLIRRSNTWKHIQFKTFLTQVRLEPFDTILFDLVKPFIASAAVKGVLFEVTYDPENNLITIDAELPIRSGEMVKYDYYWPAGLPATTGWPRAIEIEEGFAGGYGPGRGVQGTIDDCSQT